MSDDMTEAQVKKALHGIPGRARPATVCALVGHSNIVTSCFGYVYCARCDAQIGDALAGVFNGDGVVIVGHDCEHCRKNATGLTWRDTIMTPDPFPKRRRGRARGTP